MTNTPSPKHVFMSYSRRDEAVMRRVAGFLRNQGINVWVDNEKLEIGTQTWKKEIEKAIMNAGAVIVLLSPDANASIWVEREIGFAETHEKRIFPVLITGNERNAIPISLTNYHRVDLRQNEDVGLSSLSSALSTYLANLEGQRIGKDIENLVNEKTEQETADNTSKTFINSTSAHNHHIAKFLLAKIERLKLFSSNLQLLLHRSAGREISRSRLRQLLILFFWLLVVSIAPIIFFSFYLGLNTWSLFWGSMIIFGVIGLSRGIAKETLVSFSAILAIALNHLLHRYIPFINSIPNNSTSLFWVRTEILVVVVYFGYQVAAIIPSIASKTTLISSQYKKLGIVPGIINGYLVSGTILFYLNEADYPFPNVIAVPTGHFLEVVQTLMAWMPPHLLGEPSIYIAVILIFILVLIIFV